MYKKNAPEKVRQFVIFALEEYRAAKNMSGKEAFNLFETSGLFCYIEEFFDILHSRGSEYLICDFDDYLSGRQILTFI